MPSSIFEIRQCMNPACGFRFPCRKNSLSTELCPRCRFSVQVVENLQNQPEVDCNSFLSGPVVEVFLDNIRSAFNVGAMFRTADGSGLEHIHLCGMTPTPDNPKISKTSLGAEYSTPWTYYPDGLSAVKLLKEKGMALWALECSSESVSIYDAVNFLPEIPLLLVVGNEVTGVDPGILRLCERMIKIPMQGYKRSLNVAVAFGIAVYTLRFVKPLFHV
jgi:23S rRNA (guanosine2251-2'-O)-methyltransferase